jgi:hypothetical protein
LVVGKGFLHFDGSRNSSPGGRETMKQAVAGAI